MMKKLLVLIFFAVSIATTDAQWKTNGPIGPTVSCLAANGSSIFAGTFNNGIFLSTDNGGTWNPVNNGLIDSGILSIVVNGSNVFAGADSEGVFLSTNNGSNWTVLGTSLTTFGVDALAGTDSSIFAGTVGNAIFLSTNNGNWANASTGLTDPHIFSIAINGSNIFAGTATGGIFLSNNNGSNWTAINNGLPYDDAIFAFAISDSNIFAGTIESGVFLSKNNGGNWVAVNNGLTDFYITSLAISGSSIFAGTIANDSGYYGVFMSADNGGNWTAINDGLSQNETINALVITDSTIFAGTPDGVYQRPLSDFTTGIQEINATSPTQFKLYPNPTNGNLQLSVSGELIGSTLEIYDAEGRLVSHSEISTQNSQLNLTLAAGIYIATLKNGDGVATQKLVVTK